MISIENLKKMINELQRWDWSNYGMEGDGLGNYLEYDDLIDMIDDLEKDANENKETKDIYLKLMWKSWMNFFRVWYGKKNTIELIDGSTLGNFSTLIQELEGQFREKTGFDESFYDLLELDNPLIELIKKDLKLYEREDNWFEVAKSVLCANLVELVYLPMRNFIRSINTEGKPYDFGVRIDFFKYLIDKTIDFLKKGKMVIK